MGNICFKEKREKEDNTFAKRKELRSSILTEDHQQIEYNHSDIQVKEARSQSKANIESSFNKNNMIGAYFCGGSALEQNAISYHQRMQDFQQIMKKEQEIRKKQKKGSKKEIKQLDQEDLRKTLIQKFQIQMFQHVKHEELQKCIKKGPPIKYRWSSWKSHLMRISNKNINFSDMRQMYQKYNQFESKEEVQIEKDINRTFPSQPFFATKVQQQFMRDNDTIIGFKPLKRVLVSISNMYPHLGYCQGMNFILGFILMINGSKEDEAFWMFKVLAEHPDFMLMGLYENDLPLLKFLEFVAKQILKEQCKELMDFFENNDIPDSFWLTKWILTLFLYNFPVKVCSRFWDYIITNDIFSLIKLFIPLLNIFKKEFMSHEDPCSFMECFNLLTQDEEKLTNPHSEFYLKINDLVKKADSYKIEKKTIAKYAIKYLNCYEKNNEYAKLYSYYAHPQEFLTEHEKLLELKVRQPHDLSSVPEERDGCEYSSITKQESQLKKYGNSENNINNSDRLHDSKKSNQCDQDSKVISTNHEEISHWSTAVDIQIKQNLQCPTIKKTNSSQNGVITYSDQQDRKESLKLKQTSKLISNDHEEISQQNTAVDMQQKEQKELMSSKKTINNDESQYQEREQSSQSEIILNLPINIQNLKQNQQENPERGINSDFSDYLDSSMSQDLDSDESKDNVPQQDLNMPKTNSSNIKRTSKKNTYINEHQETLTFDHESYNMFQSLMNRSIDTSIQKKESLGFHRSLDDSNDNQFHIEEQEVGNDYISRDKIFQYKSQQIIVKSTLSSQYDLSKTDKNEHSPCFKKYTLEIRKDPNLNNSTLSECNNKSEIQTYQMQ